MVKGILKNQKSINVVSKNPSKSSKKKRIEIQRNEKYIMKGESQ